MAAPRKPFEPPTQEQADFLQRTIEQYGKATYNFAFRLTQNEADARDLTQEAYIRVYRAWRSSSQAPPSCPGSTGSSQTSIGTNFGGAKDVIWKRYPRTTLPRPSAARARSRSNRSTSTSRARWSEPVSKALAALSPDQRQVVVLADIEEPSYQEIAEIAGCSIGTVRSRLHRARHQLRKLIEKYSATTT